MPLSDAETMLAPVRIGEVCERVVRFTREDIAAFARLSGDSNPLHQDLQAARRARRGDLIASGQQTTAQLMGLAASHFSRGVDGQARELLCLNFNFAFKAPVLAERELLLHWRVTSVEWNAALEGWLAHVDGSAAERHGQACVIGRGTLLVKTGVD
ncbi:MaoC family dehydratase [Roseateles saccharophilus]|uniref:Acyl dehydratase n=1 Tax=Roseateles saccharophilus TaxID=304 RepID=A0A4V2VSA4_ROSSA|nr:MaoC family dehydratase [Roseateles saccharophilus]TCV01190.1 acyl dehydratase [Roseateles saccharophilus]